VKLHLGKSDFIVDLTGTTMSSTIVSSLYFSVGFNGDIMTSITYISTPCKACIMSCGNFSSKPHVLYPSHTFLNALRIQGHLESNFFLHIGPVVSLPKSMQFRNNMPMQILLWQNGQTVFIFTAFVFYLLWAIFSTQKSPPQGWQCLYILFLSVFIFFLNKIRQNHKVSLVILQ